MKHFPQYMPSARHVTMLALACMLLAGSGGAWALDCESDVDDLSFGGVDLTTGNQYTTSGLVVTKCVDGPPLQWVTFCPNIGSGTGGGHDPRYLKKYGGSEKLRFNLYPAGSSAIWGSFLWPYAPRPPVYHFRLNWFGEATHEAEIEARLFGGQNAHTKGTYTSRFSGSHILFQYKLGRHRDCKGADSSHRPRFRVRVRNKRSCQVSATDLDFGTVGALTTNIDSTSQVTVRCTFELPYKIKLLGPNNPLNRKMSNGSDQITYGTYRDAARTLPWGRFNSNDVDDTGTGYDQHFTVYGRVPPQSTPPAGTYTDTITVRVTF